VTPRVGVGDIWKYNCRPKGEEWDVYHLLITEFFEAVQYRSETCAARCLVLETGGKYEVYADELSHNGDKVA
jgi:hypothetical protein